MKIFLIPLLTALFALPAYAEDEKEIKQEETPVTKWIAAEERFLDSLPLENRQVYMVLRNKHDVIRTVRVVIKEIDNAQKLCAKENEEIRDEITTRFKEWKKSVKPILDEAESFLATELKEQKAFYRTDYSHLIKLNDKAYEYSNERIVKKPVTTLEACQKLLNSMNKSEDQLVDLLQTTLLPEEVVRTRLRREGKGS
ncbi:MAG: hypothetical protein AAF549_03835 [Pseudomonadota bacterium]